MRLVYLKEGLGYTADTFKSCVLRQLDRQDENASDGLDSGFLDRLRESINSEFDSAVVRDTGKNEFVFRYLGLYDYVDSKTGKNLTFFFAPKFINQEDWIRDFPQKGRDVVLQAIDRYNKEWTQISDQSEHVEKKHESILEIAVRFLRDYLERGLYVVSHRELELNGQGEIDWNSTIDTFQPVIKRGRPYYMNVLTEQSYSDEDHYITRLQKCLVTTWGQKLEDLGLSSVLRVNVPLLSEEKIEHFGDESFQVSQIDRELNVQFVTRARETLKLMRELIQRSSENQALNYESLSFGLPGGEHLWETACADVLDSELDHEMYACGFTQMPEGLKFSEYVPSPFWFHHECPDSVDSSGGVRGSEEAASRKLGWRLDFIRTCRTDGGAVDRLVILDAKYYCVKWNGASISGQPGMADITKQIFYQMAFQGVIGNDKIVNAFLFPEDDSLDGVKGVKLVESVSLKSPSTSGKGDDPTEAFKDIKLFAIRLPALKLLEMYANAISGDEWFKRIIEFGKRIQEMSRRRNARYE